MILKTYRVKFSFLNDAFMVSVSNQSYTDFQKQETTMNKWVVWGEFVIVLRNLLIIY